MHVLSHVQKHSKDRVKVIGAWAEANIAQFLVGVRAEV